MEHYEIIGHKEIKKVLMEGGLIMLVGDVNTGKTTLAHKLFRLGKYYHERVVYLDLDIGQSSTFLPGTMNLNLYKGLRFVRKTYFVGKFSPSGIVEDVIKGVSLFRNYLIDIDAKFVVVDTTGYVKGTEALMLKRMKAEILNPSLIIILGRESKDIVQLFEVFNSLFPGRVFRFTPSSKVRIRDAEERREYREGLLRLYFEKGYVRRCKMNEVIFVPGAFLVSDENLSQTLPGRYVGLLEGMFAMECGLIKEVNRDEIEILTTYRGNLKGIKMKLGDVLEFPYAIFKR